MWVRFTRQFRWKPRPGVMIRYPEGMRICVTRACAARAIAKGAAVKSTNPNAKKGPSDGEATDGGQSVSSGGIRQAD